MVAAMGIATPPFAMKLQRMGHPVVWLALVRDL
jgi:hypothetical protein